MGPATASRSQEIICTTWHKMNTYYNLKVYFTATGNKVDIWFTRRPFTRYYQYRPKTQRLSTAHSGTAHKRPTETVVNSITVTSLVSKLNIKT